MEDLVKVVSIIKEGSAGIAAIALFAAYKMWSRQNTLTDKLLEVIANNSAVLSSLKTLIEQRKGGDG